MSTTRYNLVMADNMPVLVSNTGANILKHLAKAGSEGLTYSELHRRTRVPLNSLYVFAARLRSAKLISGHLHNRETTLFLRDPKAKLKKVRCVG